MSLLDGKQTSQLLQYIHSSDIDAPFKVKVGTLDGDRPTRSHREIIEEPVLRRNLLLAASEPDSIRSDSILSDLVVTVEVFSNGRSLALPTQTSYKPFTTKYNWNEWLTLPLKFSDLPRHALLAFTVWDLYGPHETIPIGGTTLSIFKKSGVMRQGNHELKLWPGTQADGSEETTTPGKYTGTEAARLSKLSQRHAMGEIANVEWLDKFTFREIGIITDEEHKKTKEMCLNIEFPRVKYNEVENMVMYFEKDLDVSCRVVKHEDRKIIFDPDVGLDNLVDEKHHKLSRNATTQVIHKDIRLEGNTKNKLAGIVAKCSTSPLTVEEKDLIWKYRFHLMTDKKALSKFIHSVKWTNPEESKLALEAMSTWEAMDFEDALELLGPQITHLAVRKYAVTRLMKASDDDLVLFLLQLVQALKYEPSQKASPPAEPLPGVEPVTRPEATSEANELQRSKAESLADAMQEEGDEENTDVTAPLKDLNLKSFLIERACRSDVLASYLFWYLTVESEGQSNSPDRNVNQKDKNAQEQSLMYANVLKLLCQSLKNGNREQALRREMLRRQQIFVRSIVNIGQLVAQDGLRTKKIEKLQSLLREPNALGLNMTEGIALPLNPNIRVTGINPDKAIIFKSKLKPFKLTFLTDTGEEYSAIFKHGDDLRQDQIVLQIIKLMDILLRRENQDLKLTPYSVLATSSRHGFVEFIESRTVSDIVAAENSITDYFKKCAPCSDSPYGFSPEVMDNYVKSCAGYCVITYILGVGDRHLENLMLTKTGHLFHIDFGFILGQEVRPFPPPMKLSKEMVEAMGGLNAEPYNQFKQQCFTAMLNLRRQANLILNLFSLMVDANVPGILQEPDKTVKKVEDKFLLNMSEERVCCELGKLIDQSATAVLPNVVEQFHKLAQNFRN